MKRKRLFSIVLFSLLATFMLNIAMASDDGGGSSKYSTGIAGKTNSPGEGNCTSCHTGNPVNTGGGSVTITSPDLTGWAYTPGQTYTINVTVTKTTMSLFALDFEALLSTGANAGNLVITNSTETQILLKTVGGNSRKNVVHNNGGVYATDTHMFSFNWVAPATGTGSITFYVSGLAADASTDETGDYTYTSSQVVTEAIVLAPVANFTGSPTTICQGGSIAFTDQSSNTPTSWLWDFGDGQTSTDQYPVSHIYVSSGTFTVSLTATNAGGSDISTMTDYITVNPTLVPDVSITPDATTVCPGTTVTITATPFNGGTPSYSWTVDGNIVGTNSDTYSAIFTDGQSVVCTMTSDATCADPTTAISSPFITGVYTVASVIITETTGTLTSDAANGNQWYEQTGGIIGGAIGQSYSPSINGNYYTIVTDANGCTSTSNIISFVLSIENNLNNHEVIVYPNPSKGIVNISFEKSITNGQLIIEDFTGKEVYNEKINQKNGSVKTIDLSKYSTGVYFFKINEQKYKVVFDK